MTKPARLLAPVLFCAVFGFAQGANAVTVIGINGTAATLTCDFSCVGYTGATVGGVPTELGTEGLFADLYTLPNSSLSTQTAAMEVVSGESAATWLGMGEQQGLDLNIDATELYFLLKIGRFSTFFRNTSGGALVLSYATNGATGVGLSNVTAWVPLPAALPMFLLALGGAALVARRRRGVVGAA